jgi:hypothetical protein
MESQEREYVVILQVLSIISLISSLLVIVNLCMIHCFSDESSQFSHLQIYQGIAFIAIGNMIGNAGYLSESRPSTGDTGCTVEGFFQQFGYPASWLWTLQLAATIFCLVIWEKVPTSRVRAHLICWFIPLTFAFGQLGAGGFGDHDSNEEYDICSNRQSDRSSTIYHYTTFYGLLLVVVLLMLAMRLKLLYLRCIEDARMLSPMVVVLRQHLEVYPILLLICWVPHAIIHLFPHHVSQGLHLFSIALKIIHGVLLCFVYFYQSPPGRKMMLNMFRPSFWQQNSLGSVRLSNLQVWSISGRSTVFNDLHRKTVSDRKTDISLASELMDATDRDIL